MFRNRVGNYLVFIVVLLAVEVAIYFFLSYNYRIIRDDYHKNKLTNFQNEYQTIINGFEKISKTLYSNVINKEEILELYRGAKDGTKEERAVIREKLYEKLKNAYESLKQEGVKQLHFHLPNSDSFLRFHKPSKFGDNLYSVRFTINDANKYKKIITGFEEGRIYNGFRYVYPLSYKNEHLGSVEVSVSFNSLKSEFEKLFFNRYDFLLDKKRAEKKLFKEELALHYANSNLSDDFYFEKKSQDIENKFIDDATYEKIAKELKPRIKERLREYKPFSEHSKVDGVDYLSMFLPIKEYSGDYMAYIVEHTNRNLTSQIQKGFYKDLFLVTVIWFLLLLFLHKTVSRGKETERINEVLQKKVEKELAERMRSAKLFKEVIDSTDSEIVLLDKEYKYVIINNGFKNLHKLGEEDVIGKTVFEAEDIFNSEFKEELKVLLDEVLKGETLKFKKSVPIGQKEVYMDIVFTPFVPKSSIEGIIVFAKDISKEYMLEQENFLNQKKVAMGELIGIIAHQLKQPLNVLSLTKDTVVFDYEDGELDSKKIESFDEMVSKQINFMSKSIDDLRNFFSPNKTEKPFSLKTATEKALSIVATQISGKGIELNIILEEDRTVIGIENEIQQVVLNIVTNAKDAILDNKIAKGRIDLKLFIENSNTVITIEDNAGGIPEEIIDRVFDSYFTTKGEKGTGIGLNLSKMIVEESLGGTLGVKNSENGAIFRIELPINS